MFHVDLLPGKGQQLFRKDTQGSSTPSDLKGGVDSCLNDADLAPKVV